MQLSRVEYCFSSLYTYIFANGMLQHAKVEVRVYVSIYWVSGGMVVDRVGIMIADYMCMTQGGTVAPGFFMHTEYKKKKKKNRLRAPNDYRDGTNKNITGTMRFELQLPSSTFRVSIMFGIMIFRYLCGLFEESYMKGIWLRFIGALDIHIIFHQSSKTIFLM